MFTYGYHVFVRRIMMRKFMVKVNGNAYEVEIDEIQQGASAPVSVASAPVVAAPAVSAPAPAPVKQEVAKPAVSAAPSGAYEMKAPMPGTIVGVTVAVGAAVKKGDVIIVLEAMKMENEIKADRDGKIASISVTKGSTVSSGDPLFSIQ